VSLRREDGPVILMWQASTSQDKVHALFADRADKTRPEGGSMATVEVRGMNPCRNSDG
jgi:hypothetical protein